MMNAVKLDKALTVSNIEAFKPRVLEFDGQWRNSLGTPEAHGSMIIYGMPKNGKTDFSLKLAKYLTRFGRVVYNSVEEGLSASMQHAILRNQIAEVAARFNLLNREPLDELIMRLKRKNSAMFVFIDSVQRMGLTTAQYNELLKKFPRKMFIFISHVDGNRNPDGRAAQNIKRYSDTFVFVDGFVAKPTCRVGGGERFVIWDEGAVKSGKI